MADIFVHLTAVEHLCKEPRLHPELALALNRDHHSAKLGGIFLDLPDYGQVLRRSVRQYLGLSHPLNRWVQTLHSHQPTLLGLAFAEIAQTDIEYAEKMWPLSFVAGYFSHLALDRVLKALVQRLVRENLGPGENAAFHLDQYERYQSLLFHQEVYGKDILGKPFIREMADIFRIKPGTLEPEVVRFLVKGCIKALGYAPKEAEIKRWAKGFYYYAYFLSLSMAKQFDLEENENYPFIVHTLYRNDFFNFNRYYERALELATDYMNNVYAFMKCGDFSVHGKAEFFDIVPELDLNNPPDEDLLYTITELESRDEEDVEMTQNIIPFSDPKKTKSNK